MTKPKTQFEALIQEAFSCSKQEIEEFFEEKFLKSLTHQLDTTDIPAETIRNKRQQTQTIKNIFLTFAQK